MATASIWSKVAVAIQSALGAAKTITAITKASPGVVTSTAHGIANGAYVLMTIQGMTQLDGRVFRVANQAANTIELEGENTTLYDTFSSGTMQEITYGTNMTTARGLTASGGDFNFIDTTTIHDDIQKRIPGVANAASFQFESIWDVSDAGLIALKAASDVKGTRAVRITFANGQKIVFNGFAGATLLPTGSAQDLVTTAVNIEMFGKPTTYAT